MITNQSKQFWIGLILILSLGLLARGLFFYRILSVSGIEGFYAKESGDADEYIALARNFTTGKFTQGEATNFSPEQFRMPGYPLFISLLSFGGRNLVAVILAQNILFLTFIGLFFWFLERRVGLLPTVISSFILALDPTIIYWNNQITSETLFTIGLGISVFYLFRFTKDDKTKSLSLSLIWLLISVYVRPISLYLPVIWSLLVLFIAAAKKFTWQKTAALCILLWTIWLGGTVPWRLRNYQLSGRFIFSTSTAIGFGKYITAMKVERGEALWNLPENDLLKRIALRRQETIQYIAAHPLLFAKIYLTSLAPFLLGDGYMNSLSAIFPNLKNAVRITDWKGGAGELIGFLKENISAGNTLFVAGKIIWGGIILLALLGAWSLFRSRQTEHRLLLVILLFVIYYFALASGIGSYSRFRFPVNPLIFILVSYGILWMSKEKIKD